MTTSSAPMITDPAAAAAAGKCYIARNRAADKLAIDSFHPGPCEWCPYPIAKIAGWLADFNRWAGWTPGEGRYTDPEVQRFVALPRPEQRARTHAAAYPKADS